MQDYLENGEPRMVSMLLIGIIVLAIALQAAYLLWPQIKAYRNVSTSRAVLANAVNSSDGLEQQLKQTQDEVDALARRLHGDMAGLPAKQMESYIIGRLQKVSWDTDVELVSVKPGDGTKVQMFRESLFQVKVRARYSDFISWLREIQRQLGFIVVKKFDITPQGRDLSDPKLGIALTMVSYRMVDGG